jgi:DNA topoisomerase-1
MGHIAELADKNMTKLVKNNFEPTYEIIENKNKVIRELQSDAKKASQVWIATDEDRE